MADTNANLTKVEAALESHKLILRQIQEVETKISDKLNTKVSTPSEPEIPKPSEDASTEEKLEYVQKVSEQNEKRLKTILEQSRADLAKLEKANQKKPSCWARLFCRA